MKLLLVIDIADDVVEAYEDFTVDYDLRGTPKDDQKVNESIKYVEDCPLKPMPNKKPVSYHDDLYGEVEKNFTNIGWNACIKELEN